MSLPRPVQRSEVPPRDFTLAAWFHYDMDELAALLGVKPTSETFEEADDLPMRFRSIYLDLGGNKYASLTQTETHQGRIEIDLELHNGQLLDEADLARVLTVMPPNCGKIHKIDNGFTWVPL